MTIEKIAQNTKISKEIISEMRDEVEYWKSFDMRYTAAPHMSNHLTFLIYHYALIFGKDYWPKNITVGGLLIKDGEKISKSKGNGIPLFRIKDIYGADLYRLYIGLTSNFDLEMDFKENEVSILEKKFDKWKELLKSSSKYEKIEYEKFDNLDKWLISKFYTRAKKYFSFMDNNMRIREAYIQIFYEVLNDINYHIRRCNIEKTSKVIKFFARDYLILMSPIVPHICEELNNDENEFITLAKFETKPETFINQEIEQTEDIIIQLQKNIAFYVEKNPQIKKISIVQSKLEKFDLFDKLKILLENKTSPKDIFQKLNEKFSSQQNFIKKFVPKCFKDGLSFYLSKTDEKKLLVTIINFLEKEFNCKIEIVDNDNLEKPIYAIPSNPGIF